MSAGMPRIYTRTQAHRNTALLQAAHLRRCHLPIESLTCLAPKTNDVCESFALTARRKHNYLQDASLGEGRGCTRQFSDTPCSGDRPTCPSASDFWRVLAQCKQRASGNGSGPEALSRSDWDRAGEVMSEQQRQDSERDLYRDTWVRYLGYANEVGEAFRSMVPAAVVWLSYGVSSSYVLADALDKGKKAGEAPSPEAGRSTRVALAVVDTFVWQSLASVAIPGFTINRLCAASLYALGTMTRWPLTVRKWTTTTLGLLAIPVIIHPIDRSVDFLLDSSLRKLYPSVGKPSSS